MDVLDMPGVGVLVPVAALAVAIAQRHRPPASVHWWSLRLDRRDLVVMTVLYVVVGLFRLAFAGFGTGSVAGLFLSFAAGLLVGVVGPIWYTVWYRRRPLRDLGIGLHRIGQTLAWRWCSPASSSPSRLGLRPAPAARLGTAAGHVACRRRVRGRVLPRFIQSRLEASFGTATGVGGAAALYALYHVGYGMGGGENSVPARLGLNYAIAYRLVSNVLVLWSILTPIGGVFNNLDADDITLPWASIAGFADVAAIIVAVLIVARRHERGLGHAAVGRDAEPHPQPTR